MCTDKQQTLQMCCGFMVGAASALYAGSCKLGTVHALQSAALCGTAAGTAWNNTQLALWGSGCEHVCGTVDSSCSQYELPIPGILVCWRRVTACCCLACPHHRPAQSILAYLCYISLWWDHYLADPEAAGWGLLCLFSLLATCMWRRIGPPIMHGVLILPLAVSLRCMCLQLQHATAQAARLSVV